MDYGSPGSTVHGIFQTRILEWIAIPFSRGSSPPRDQTSSPALAGEFFITGPPGSPGILYIKKYLGVFLKVHHRDF